MIKKNINKKNNEYNHEVKCNLFFKMIHVIFLLLFLPRNTFFFIRSIIVEQKVKEIQRRIFVITIRTWTSFS